MWLIVFGVIVGVLSGMLGIGGGIVLVPGLILLFGFSQLQAQGTSLAVLSLPICLAAATIYYQHGHVRPAVVGLIAVGFVVGAIGGAKLIEFVPVNAMRVALGALLLYLGLTMVLEGHVSRTAAALPAAFFALLTTLVARRWRRTPRVPGVERSGPPEWQAPGGSLRSTPATLTPGVMPPLAPPSTEFEYHI